MNGVLIYTSKSDASCWWQGLDRCFKGFDVEAHMRFDLVMPVDVLIDGFELMPLLFVDAVEAFRLPVCFP
jgi:hypothetical protein